MTLDPLPLSFFCRFSSKLARPYAANINISGELGFSNFHPCAAGNHIGDVQCCTFDFLQVNANSGRSLRRMVLDSFYHRLHVLKHFLIVVCSCGRKFFFDHGTPRLGRGVFF